MKRFIMLVVVAVLALSFSTASAFTRESIVKYYNKGMICSVETGTEGGQPATRFGMAFETYITTDLEGFIVIDGGTYLTGSGTTTTMTHFLSGTPSDTFTRQVIMGTKCVSEFNFDYTINNRNYGDRRQAINTLFVAGSTVTNKHDLTLWAKFEAGTMACSNMLAYRWSWAWDSGTSDRELWMKCKKDGVVNYITPTGFTTTPTRYGFMEAHTYWKHWTLSFYNFIGITDVEFFSDASNDNINQATEHIVW